MESNSNSKINTSYFYKLALLILLPSAILIGIAKYLYADLSIHILSTIPLIMLVMGFWAFFLFKLIERNPKKMNAVFSVNMLLKIFLSILAITVVALTAKENLVAYVLIFFVLYIILLVFETKYMAIAGKSGNR